MQQIVFIEPSGNDIKNPSLDFLRDVIFNEGENYWHYGAGEGGLSYSEEEDDFLSHLILDFAEPYGFCVRYLTPSDDVGLVLVYSHPKSDTVTIYPGGDPYTLPNSYFVPREIAWKAVEEFCRSGKQLEELQWEDFNPPADDEE